jgi:uncharacterized membrane protein YhhN
VPTNRRRQFVHAQTAWLLVTLLVLTLLESHSYELFFVVSLVGFLVLTELTEPVRLTPQWRRRIRWLIPPALLVFGYVALRHIVASVPDELVPLLLQDGSFLRMVSLLLDGGA